MFPTAPDAASALITDAGILIGLLTMARLLDPTRASHRVLFGVTAAAFLAIYALWRVHDTLPPAAATVQSMWPRLFLAFEMTAICYTLMSIAILFRNVDRAGEADAAERRMDAESSHPPVDVFICTYDEPIEILERSILSALALDYPRFAVWVLDDTRRDWLRDYCDRVGAGYVTRPDNVGAKAGNLNNGLAETARVTDAPVVMVLDADFAPRPNFLRRTVGLLTTAPDVAIVQTPQTYYNADPIQHNLAVATSFVDDQRFFFDVFQPAKDAWGCAFCVGTSFVVRRDLLVEIGGFPTAAISEDIHLTYALLARGYRTLWLNEPLSAGLAAEGIPEYLTQRARWCLGTVQVALLRDGPFRGAGYRLAHRLHYLHGLLNWFCKPFMVLLLVAPSLYWFAGIPAFEADYLSFLRYGVPALFCNLVYMGWVSRSRTLPLLTEATHAVASFAITAALLSAAVKPFGRPFKITEKGGDRSVPRVSRKLAACFGLLAASSALGVVWAFVSPYGAGEISPLDYFNLLWAAVAMLVAFVAFLVCFERPRTEDVFALDAPAWIWRDGAAEPCEVAAMSASTATLRLPPGDAGAAPDLLHLDGLGWIPIVSVRPAGDALLVGLRPDEPQRRALVARLYGEIDAGIAAEARAWTAFGAVARRPFRRA